jgi:hypothetical protein
MRFRWACLLRLRRREPTPDTLIQQRVESPVAQLGAGLVKHQGILRHRESAPESHLPGTGRSARARSPTKMCYSRSGVSTSSIHFMSARTRSERLGQIAPPAVSHYDRAGHREREPP